MIHPIYKRIDQLRISHSVAELCAIFGVSRSGFYKWKQRKMLGLTNRYEEAHRHLDTCVSDIHAHFPMMGYRAIRAMLALRFGLAVSDPSVWKSMCRLHISGFSRRTRYSSKKPGLEHVLHPNLLNRDFSASAPLQKIVTDVTYLKFRGKWHYFVAYLDLFNNEILDWDLSDTFDNFLVLRPAQRLMQRLSQQTESTARPVLLHSDQGPQYSSVGFSNLLSQYHITQSMSRAGTPHDNAVMESFLGRFKDTLRIHYRYWEKDDLRAVVADCVHYFNNVRPIRKLKGKPPVLFRASAV